MTPEQGKEPRFTAEDAEAFSRWYTTVVVRINHQDVADWWNDRLTAVAGGARA